MAVNKCDPIMKDAFRGIELNYKLNSAIASLPRNQKFSAEQLENMLKKAPHNVSPYEIKASRLFDNFRGDNRTFTAEEWNNMNLGQQMFETRVGGNDYIDITLGKKGEESGTYYTKEFMATKQDKSTNLSHRFDDADESRPTNELLQLRKQLDDLVQSEGGNKNLLKTMKTEEYKDLYSKIRNLEESEAGYIRAPSYDNYSQLGWNRVHQDTINGKKTTVLNELQSDWLQAERQGAGTFESKIKASKEEYYTLRDRIEDARYGNNPENLSSEETNALEEQLKALPIYSKGVGNEIADFPMKPEKFHQLMIVDAINEAIENGTNRVAIPIQRENELMGSAGVTRFYEGLNPSKEAAIEDVVNIKKFRLGKLHKQIVDGVELDTNLRKQIGKAINKDVKNSSRYEIKQALEDAYQFNIHNRPSDKEVEKYINSKILPDIQKKLGKQGLEIKLGKEDYQPTDTQMEDRIASWEDEVQDYIDNFMEGYSVGYPDMAQEVWDKQSHDATMLDFFIELRNSDIPIEEVDKMEASLFKQNDLHIIEVVQKPNTPVRWDVYALISALGLTDQAIELSKEEN